MYLYTIVSYPFVTNQNHQRPAARTLFFCFVASLSAVHALKNDVQYPTLQLNGIKMFYRRFCITQNIKTHVVQDVKLTS